MEKSKKIKITELRLGNYIIDKIDDDCTIECEVIEISKNGTVKIKDSQDDYTNKINQIAPILLTEDWLINFGFKKDDNGNYWIPIEIETWLQLTVIDMFYPMICQAGELSHEKENYVSLNGIQYVHQLQNLFFAITGKELELTQEKSAEL